MATQTLQHPGQVVVAPRQGEELAVRARGFFGSVAYALAPYFGHGTMELLGKEGRAKLTARDRAVADAYLLGIF